MIYVKTLLFRICVWRHVLDDVYFKVTWKEVITAYFENFPEAADENNKYSFGVKFVLAEIRTGHLTNINHYFCRLK